MEQSEISRSVIIAAGDVATPRRGTSELADSRRESLQQ
jgi:hypothetical protein